MIGAVDLKEVPTSFYLKTSEAERGRKEDREQWEQAIDYVWSKWNWVQIMYLTIRVSDFASWTELVGGMIIYEYITCSCEYLSFLNSTKKYSVYTTNKKHKCHV